MNTTVEPISIKDAVRPGAVLPKPDGKNARLAHKRAMIVVNTRLVGAGIELDKPAQTLVKSLVGSVVAASGSDHKRIRKSSGVSNLLGLIDELAAERGSGQASRAEVAALLVAKCKHGLPPFCYGNAA